MKTRTSDFAFLGLCMLAVSLIASCSFGASGDAAGGKPFAVSVSLGGASSPGTRAIFGDSTLTAVSILVWDAAGTQIGSGDLVKRTTIWQANINVSATGDATFKAYAKNGGTLLYYGEKLQNLGGSNDHVSIPAAANPSVSYNFTTNPGWTVAGDWVWGTPDGTVDFDNGYTEPGTTLGSCYGTDFSATGVHDGVSPGMTFETNYLQMGPIDLSSFTGTGSPQLKFKMWFDNDVNLDYGHILVSTDGSTWSLASSVSPPYELNSTTGGPTDPDSWSAYMNAWTDIVVNLASYESATKLYIRWAYLTDPSEWITYGWYVDNVQVGRF
jgi:hypothetical protein